MRRLMLFTLLIAAWIGAARLVSTPAAAQSDPTPLPTAAPDEVIYVVQRGDSLGAIATRFGTTVTAIMRRNGLINRDVIQIGLQLIIPPRDSTPISPTGEASATPDGDPAITATPMAVTNLPGETATLDFAFPTPTLAPTSAIAPPLDATPTRMLPTAAPTPTPVSALPFALGGQVISFSYPRQMSAAGMTWARSIIRWTPETQPDVAQGAIDAARANGFRVLLTVVGDPADLETDFVRTIQAFATFLGRVAALQPDAIEVWTAPNLSESWGAVSPAGYVQMLALAYEAIKRAHPGTLVISGAPTATDALGCSEAGCEVGAFARAVAGAGGADVADCIGVRYLEGAVAPDLTTGDPRGEAERYYLPPVVTQFAAAFPNKPLCFVEVGYLAGDRRDLADSLAWSTRTTVQDQAEWLARAAILLRQTGRVWLMMVWNVDATAYMPDDPQAAYAIVQDGQCLACITLGAVMGAR